MPVRMLMAMGVRPLSCSWRLCRGRGTGGAPPSLPEEAAVPAGGGGGGPGCWALPRSLMGGRHFFFRIPAGAASPMGGGAGFGVPTPAMAACTFVGVGQGQQQGVPGECLAVGPGGVAPGVSVAPCWLHSKPLAASWSLALACCRHKLPWPVWAPRGHQGVICGERRKLGQAEPGTSLVLTACPHQHIVRVRDAPKPIVPVPSTPQTGQGATLLPWVPLSAPQTA